MASITQQQQYEIAFRAMNCGMGAWVIADDEAAACGALAAVEGFMHATEAVLSRFQPDSDLSQLNARAGRTVSVHPVLWDALNLALAWARETSGLYDPTILDALEAAGYDRSFELIHDDANPLQKLAPTQASWRDIRLDPVTCGVTLPVGLRVDLGGIAKGWAADCAAELLSAVGPCLVDAGGDIVARGAPLDWPAWPVGVADPRQADTDLALLMLKDRGVATSGTDYRRWQRGGVLQHHVIDPRTRRPAQTDLVSVTVIAPTATQADVYAKLALILGAEEGYRYLSEAEDTEALLVGESGELWETSSFGQYVYHPEPVGF